MGATMTRDGRGRRDRPGHPVAMAIAVLLALIALAGCRKPDPVYDRVPRPVGTRDIVRAERRDGTMLSEAERLAVLGAHDRYIAAFDALRQAELVPFAEELRSADAESIARDERKLRSLVSRHLGIIGRIESLDESFLTEVSAALGPGREGFVARLRNRRVLDRASALSAGDGGRALLDVRQLVDQLALGESDRIATEPLLQEFETQAVSIAAEITREQATLPLSYLAVLERRGSAESSVDGSLRDDARRKAQERAEFERYAESRRDLERLLFAYADLADRTIESIASVLGEEDATYLRRRLLRLRFEDENGSNGDIAAFEALVASRARRVPADVRSKIEALRQAFLAEDESRLRGLAALHRESREPGVYDPLRARGGPDAVKRQKEQWARLDNERKDAAAKFRERFLALLPEDVRGDVEGLRGLSRDEFASAVADLVGSGRVATFTQRKPRGYADAEPPRPNDDTEERETGELRLLLAAPPDQRAIGLLVSRSKLDAASVTVVQEIVAGWRERWNAARELARTKVQQLTEPIKLGFERSDPRVFDQSLVRLIAGFDELRRERDQLEADLLASIEAAVPGQLDPAARSLWLRERAEASQRLYWSDIPFDDSMRLPTEATIAFAETLNRVPMPDADVAILASVLDAYADRLDAATERLRDEALNAVRKAVTLVIEGHAAGMNEQESLSESRPEVKRVMAPVRSAGIDLASVRLEVLAAIVAALPVESGRSAREAVVRAAYPRLLEERRRAEPALRGVGEDPTLTDAQLAAWRAVMDERSQARDRALDRLLEWSREWQVSGKRAGEDLGSRDAASRRHPQLAAVFFARDEADARAVRACTGLLTPEQRTRHHDLETYFNEPPMTVRWLD